MRDLFCILLLAFQFVFLCRIALSFFPIRPGTPAGGFKDIAFAITDPVVWPIRRRVPDMPGAIGFGIAELLILIALSVLVGLVC
jgi:uncharacterized protein YggT (Ycf19 family)